MKNEHVVMTSLESLSSSYKYLSSALKTMSTKELTIEYVTALLMHEMSKRKEKKLKGNKDSKAKGEIHLGVKMSRHATIVARRATLHVFARIFFKKKQGEKNENKTPMKMMTMHLQRNIECIHVSGSWVMHS